MLGTMSSLVFPWPSPPPCFRGVLLSLVGSWKVSCRMPERPFVGRQIIFLKLLHIQTSFMFRLVFSSLPYSFIPFCYIHSCYYWVWFLQVGDAVKDHACWERPEDMDTPRSVFKVDKNNPGSDVAAETAAALAAASLVFKKVDPTYSKTLVRRAIRVSIWFEMKTLFLDLNGILSTNAYNMILYFMGIGFPVCR